MSKLSRLAPIKVIDVELTEPLPTLEGLDRYHSVQTLVRLRGAPIGYITAPIMNQLCEASTIAKLILKHHQDAIARHLVQQGLAVGLANLTLSDLLDLPPVPDQGESPLVTVAVCTSDLIEDLAHCLNAIEQLDYPNLELLVIDNAPKTNETQR